MWLTGVSFHCVITLDNAPFLPCGYPACVLRHQYLSRAAEFPAS